MELLSEEEKKAIKELKHYINITPYWKQKEYTNTEIDNYIKIVLNLIEKQQKKIKDLEDKNYFLKEMYRGTTEYKAIKKKVEELGWD